MNNIIKSRTRTAASSNAALEVRPVDLAPIGSYLDHDFITDLDPAQVKDPVVRAHLEARGIVRVAQEEADEIRRHAYDDGFRAGMKQAAGAADELVQRLESDFETVAADRADALDALEPQALKLCMEIVEKVIRHEPKTDPRIVLRVVKSCLRQIKDSDQIHVRVSLEEVEEVKARRDELVGLAEGVREIRIVDDRRVAPGGCVVESSAGDFDARIESQLSDKLRETLQDDRDEPSPQPGEILASDQPA